MDRVALPFCSIQLTVPKPTKPLPILNTVGDHIRRRRLELNLVQRELAERIGVEVDTILNWEHNRSTPTLRHLPKVIAFLGYNPLIKKPETLGEQALQYRKRCGVSQKELARQVGIDPTTLSRLERNQGTCFPSVLRKVSTFVNAHSSNSGKPPQ
jgi:transcriptional regulator with XRE-family HTH domain